MMANLLKDLEHPVKRKFVFSTLSEQLISVGFEGYDEIQCKQKWKSLMRTYRSNKDAKNRSGSGQVRFYFFEQMDELVGNRPQNSCTHSLESATTEEEAPEQGVDIPPQPTTPVHVEIENYKKSCQKKQPDRRGMMSGWTSKGENLMYWKS